jgi:hypothetical protein
MSGDNEPWSMFYFEAAQTYNKIRLIRDRMFIIGDNTFFLIFALVSRAKSVDERKASPHRRV